MRKYYQSHVDFSEIETVTDDRITQERAFVKMQEDGTITAKGKPVVSKISKLSEAVTKQFFVKLEKRLARRRNGIRAIYFTFKRFHTAKEYNAMYLYLAIFYGFLEWQVPESVSSIAISPEVLSVFFDEFMADFEDFVADLKLESEPADKEASDIESAEIQ